MKDGGTPAWDDEQDDERDEADTPAAERVEKKALNRGVSLRRAEALERKVARRGAGRR